jgi:hypothetical protein
MLKVIVEDIEFPNIVLKRLLLPVLSTVLINPGDTAASSNLCPLLVAMLLSFV